MKQLFSNNFKTTLSAPFAAGHSTMSVVNFLGMSSPVSGEEYELLTISDGVNYEIVKVLTRVTSTLTVEREQEGTTARDWGVGADVYGANTAGTMRRFQQGYVQIADDTVFTDIAVGSLWLVRLPFDFYVRDITACVNQPPSGADIILRVEENGVRIHPDEIHIDAGDKTSQDSSNTTNTRPISNWTKQIFPKDAELKVYVSQIGSITKGRGLKVMLIGDIIG